LEALTANHSEVRPEEEGCWALPHGEFGLDVIALVGTLRYQQQRSIPQIRLELVQRGLQVAQRTVTDQLYRYEELLALHLSNSQRLQKRLSEQKQVVLALDGLQPDVGHEVVPLEQANELDEDWERTQVPQPEEMAILAESRKHIWQQVQTLPPKYRVPLVLRYYGDFSLREVADLLGQREGTVRVLVHRALHKLRQSSQETPLSEPAISLTTVRTFVK
jgi:RNA polymerase sigma factor (sigma-70 family)